MRWRFIKPSSVFLVTPYNPFTRSLIVDCAVKFIAMGVLLLHENSISLMLKVFKGMSSYLKSILNYLNCCTRDHIMHRRSNEHVIC
jgi:hypothetical protein